VRSPADDALLNGSYAEQYAVSPHQRDVQVSQLAPGVVLTQPGCILELMSRPTFCERGDSLLVREVRSTGHSELKPSCCTAVRLITCWLLCAVRGRCVAQLCLPCDGTLCRYATAAALNPLVSVETEAQRCEYVAILGGYCALASAILAAAAPSPRRRVHIRLGMERAPQCHARVCLSLCQGGSCSSRVFSERSSEDGTEEPL
jgi:hypothetical protein